MNKKMRQEAEDIIKTFDNFYPEKVEKVFYERNINYIKFFYYPNGIDLLYIIKGKSPHILTEIFHSFKTKVLDINVLWLKENGLDSPYKKVVFSLLMFNDICNEV